MTASAHVGQKPPSRYSPPPARVEVAGEREDAEQQQHADDRHDDLLQRDDGRVAVERDERDLGRDQRVADGQRAVAGGRAEQPVRAEATSASPDVQTAIAA